MKPAAKKAKPFKVLEKIGKTDCLSQEGITATEKYFIRIWSKKADVYMFDELRFISHTQMTKFRSFQLLQAQSENIFNGLFYPS